VENEMGVEKALQAGSDTQGFRWRRGIAGKVAPGAPQKAGHAARVWCFRPFVYFNTAAFLSDA
jgi:hypothetical protein